MYKFVGFALLSLSSLFIAHAQSTQMSTYCNPLNLDYTYMIYNAQQYFIPFGSLFGWQTNCIAPGWSTIKSRMN
jgi:hypothetical protein